MRAGKLRSRIRIESRSSAQSASGEQSHVWALVAVVYAEVRPMGGRELENARAVYAEASHHVVIRYQPGITTSMRVNYAGRLLNIGAVIDDGERHEQITLYCSEGLNDG